MQHWSLKLQGQFCHTWNICKHIYIKGMNDMWINDFIWDHKKGIESNMKHIWQIIWSSYVLYMRFICDDCGLCLVSPCHALFKYKKSISFYIPYPTELDPTELIDVMMLLQNISITPLLFYIVDNLMNYLGFLITYIQKKSNS